MSRQKNDEPGRSCATPSWLPPTHEHGRRPLEGFGGSRRIVFFRRYSCVVSFFAAIAIGSVSAPLVACGSAAEEVPVIGVDGGTRPTPGAPPAPSSSGSSAPSADAAPPPPPSDGGKPAEPPAPPPKADEITEQQGIFVALNGAAGAPGTRQAPLQSIAEAIAKAEADAKGRVFVCEGTYLEAIELANGISLVGGLDCRAPRGSSPTNAARSRAPRARPSAPRASLERRASTTSTWSPPTRLRHRARRSASSRSTRTPSPSRTARSAPGVG